MWSPCVTGADYTVTVDWDANGIVTGTGDDVTPDILGNGSFTFGYGRDQARQLSPSSVGRAGFVLCNVDRIYSPENTSSPLFGQLGPAREVTAEAHFQNVTYPLFTGRIDDFTVHPDRTNLSVDFSILDGLAQLQGTKLSTELFEARRTGEIINIILDYANWPDDRRDIDFGASYARFWWEEGTDAFAAIQNIVRGEGPPSIAYISPDGTFIYRDRHHRLLRTASLVSQASFAAGRVDNCPPVTGSPPVTGFDYTPPVGYEHGWRDIVNSVQEDVEEREPDIITSVVWSTTSPFSIMIGQTIELHAVASDPFRDAITPVEDTAEDGSGDYIKTGVGSVVVSLTRTSGQSTIIRITAVGGDVTILRMQLRARPVSTVRLIQISERDAASVSALGEKVYPNDIPFVTANDVFAVSQVILAHYAQRRPIVRMRVAACDEDHFLQILTRTISDRITIRNDELGLNTDFFIERADHVIRRTNSQNPPIHSVVFGCERQLEAIPAVPFIFDRVGHGFDDGFFDPLAADNPATMWIWDTQSEFDVNEFAT